MFAARKRNIHWSEICPWLYKSIFIRLPKNKNNKNCQLFPISFLFNINANISFLAEIQLSNPENFKLGRTRNVLSRSEASYYLEPLNPRIYALHEILIVDPNKTTCCENVNQYEIAFSLLCICSLIDYVIWVLIGLTCKVQKVVFKTI